jgi:probable RNA-binding protein EIF1AD
MSGLGRRSHYRKTVSDNALNSYPEPAVNEVIARVVQSRGGNLLEISLPSSAVDNEEENNSEDVSDDVSILTTATTSSTAILAMLPSKFKKLVWVKRGDYVIASFAGATTVATAAEEENNTKNDADDEDENNNESSNMSSTASSVAGSVASSAVAGSAGNKVQYMVSSILFADQIKHLKKKKLWPACWMASSEGEGGQAPAPVKDIETVEEENAAAPTLITAEVASVDDLAGEEEEYGAEEIADDFDDLYVNNNRVAAMNLQPEDSSDSEDDED